VQTEVAQKSRKQHGTIDVANRPPANLEQIDPSSAYWRLFYRPIFSVA
jgi:hypothetical protein